MIFNLDDLVSPVNWETVKFQTSIKVCVWGGRVEIVGISKPRDIRDNSIDELGRFGVDIMGRESQGKAWSRGSGVREDFPECSTTVSRS